MPLSGRRLAHEKVGIVDWDRVFGTATSGPIQPAQEAATQLLDAGLSGVSTVADRESGPASGDAARKPRPTRRPRRAGGNCGAVQLAYTLILTRGNPQLLAGRRIELVDFNVNLNGLWTISSIEHRINAAGYITSLDAEPTKPGT